MASRGQRVTARDFETYDGVFDSSAQIMCQPYGGITLTYARLIFCDPVP